MYLQLDSYMYLIRTRPKFAVKNCVVIQCSCKGWWLSVSADGSRYGKPLAASSSKTKYFPDQFSCFFSYVLSGFASLQKLEEESPDKLVGNKESTSSK
jgi:hypothetical protein